MAKNEDLLAAVDATALTAISAYFGFPIPPVLAQNVLSAISTLVCAAISVPTAWMEGVAENIKETAKARAQVTTGVVPAVIETISGDADLKSRATRHLGGRMLREQSSREAVLQQAFEHLRSDLQSAPIDQNESPTSIDEDWLNIFGKLAETRSDQTMQAYFARILSGEIRRPGRFALITLEVLSRMMKADAEAFAKLAKVIFGGAFVPADKHMYDWAGVDEDLLMGLHEAGIVGMMPTLGEDIDPGTRLFTYGSKCILLTARQTHRMRALRLSLAGRELARIAQVQYSDDYFFKLAWWVLLSGVGAKVVWAELPRGWSGEHSQLQWQELPPHSVTAPDR